MSAQITYKYLRPGAELTVAEFSKAEPLGIRQVEDIEEAARDAVGEVIRVADLRHGGEERAFKIVRVGNRTISGFVEDPSRPIDNLNVYVTDAG